MKKNIAIKVEKVSKKYCASIKRSMFYGMVDIAHNLFGFSSNSGKLRKGEFWAVKDLSFEVKKGETLGIIGLNGSGKTTILKMLNGIFWPDKGKIFIRGKTGALIALGAGFHQMLTGRENIYLNGAVLGLSRKQVAEKFDEIIDFADIPNFIDTPVKFYSSGMFTRLGFSVAITIEPDILLVDEVLSVGDQSFQNKSLQKLMELKKRSGSVVFVSHNLEHMRSICDKIIVVDNGRAIYHGSVDQGIICYQKIIMDKKLRDNKISSKILFSKDESAQLMLLDSGLIGKSNHKITEINFSKDLHLFFDFQINTPISELIFQVMLFNKDNVLCIFDTSNDSSEDFGKKYSFVEIKEGRYHLMVTYTNLRLVPGVY